MADDRDIYVDVVTYDAGGSAGGTALRGDEMPPHGWSDGIFDCFADCEVCLWGAFPLGCVQYLFAANAASVGTEDFQTAFAKVLGLTLVIPNILGAVSAAVPGAAPIVSPLNSFTEVAKAYYGMSNRAAMRRRFNIVGVTECAGLCSCFSFAFDGDVEQTDDFCCYLCCFPCAVCQETRHMRRHNLGDIGRRFAPYGQRYGYGYEGGEIDYVNGGDGRPPGGYAPPGPQMFPATRK